jgi:hypothetical protein
MAPPSVPRLFPSAASPLSTAMSLLSSASFLRLLRTRRAHALAPRRHAQPPRPRPHRQPLQDGIGCHPPRHGEKRVTAFARKIDLARRWDPLPNPRPPESSAGAAGSCDPWQGTFLGSRVHRRRSALVSPPTTPRCCRHGLLIDACSVHGLMRARQMTARLALDEVTDTGAFDRSPSTFWSSVSRDGRFPAMAGRYHLYVSYACPWASRCLAFLKLKGLDHAIDVMVRR